MNELLSPDGWFNRVLTMMNDALWRITSPHSRHLPWA